MSYIIPTTADFKARFPEFAAVPDAVIGMILTDEAIPLVDTTWLESDRRPAQLYYTAHQLALQGYPGNLVGGVSVPTGGSAQAIKRRKVGDVEVEYQNENERIGVGNTNLDRGGYGLTLYGQQFLRIMRRNFAPTIAVV